MHLISFLTFSMALQISTLNCNGLLGVEKQRLFLEYNQLNHFDVFMLQETHITDIQQVKDIEDLLNVKAFFSFGTNMSCGVGILINKNIDFTVYSFRHDDVGRVISVDVKIKEKEYRLISIYAPNVPTARVTFLESIENYLSGKRNIILGGDFNFVEDTTLDKAGGNPSIGTAGRYAMMDISSNFDLVDPHRQLHPTKSFYSYFSANEKVFTRIDRFYISKDLIPFVTKANIDPCSFSDHCFVTMKGSFSSLKNEKGPGYWKCNTSVLDDPFFKEDMVKIWEDYLLADDINDVDWWERCKVGFKNLIISHSKRISKAKKRLLYSLQNTLRSLYNKEKQFPGDFVDNISLVKENINDVLRTSAEGTRVRSRVQFFEDNEQPSSFYARKERNRAQDKVISSILNKNDDIVSDIEGIKSTVHNFYSNLFHYEPIDPNQVDSFCRNLPKLPKEEARVCEGFLTYEECWEAVQGMQNNKSPGLDGLPKEFYSKFFPLFGQVFVETVNWCSVFGELPDSQRKSVITLLCKNKENKTSLKAWRPISLLNVDYKIVSKALCNRLKKVLDNIISPDQTCSVPGRSIIDNIHLLRNVIDFADSKKIPAALLSLDQEKAFDRVSHEYMFAVLKAYGFGDSFIGWIKLLYNNVSSTVLVNGFQTDPFPITRSVRQGCSLSPLLFVLCIEPLAIALRKDDSFPGMPCPASAEVVKIVQYADDTTCVITSESSVERVLNTFDLFSKASGSKLNKGKCKGLFFGGWKYRKDCNIHGIFFSSKPLKFLGIYLASLTEPELCTHKKDIILHRHKDNWPTIFDKFTNYNAIWKSKCLTLFGKAKFCNIMSLSKLWYVGQVLNLPTAFLKRFNSEVFSFIWKDGPEYIKRKTMATPFAKGGANVTDISLKLSAFQVVHISKLVCPDFHHKWKFFAKYWLKYPLRHYFGNRAVMPSIYTPVFYKHCMDSFDRFVSLSPEPPTRDVLVVKKVYDLFVEKAYEPPSIVTKHPTRDFEVTWKGVHDPFLCPELKAIAFRSAHHVLPTNMMWHRRYQGKGRRECYFLECKGDEDLNHVFLFCPVVTPIWGFVNEVLTKVFGETVFLDVNCIVFSDVRFTSDKTKKAITLFLVNAVKRSVWLFRCKACKENYKVSTRLIFNEVDRFISLREKVDRERFAFPKFTKLWGWFEIFTSCNVSF